MPTIGLNRASSIALLKPDLLTNKETEKQEDGSSVPQRTISDSPAAYDHVEHCAFPHRGISLSGGRFG